MDYDDIDIPRRNLQLAGERRSRSSSGLKPYDFPKFDFDDNRLQGHLRFDSLVETEVFLGIQSQEDSQWIEDYSRGINGMEFNSNPADSCSISRRDNVWSEATSLESVEMLLKSVGQEEMMPAASVMLETNTCDDQDASGRHEESGADLGVRNLDISIPKDECLKDHPTPNSHVEEQLPQVGCPLLIPENTESSCAVSQDLTQKLLIESGDMAFEGKYTHDSEPACENSKELKTSDVNSITIRYGDRGDFSHYTRNNSSDNVAITQCSEASQLIIADVSCKSCNEDGKELHISAGTGLENFMTLKKTGENSFHVSTLGSTPCTLTESGVVNRLDASSASSMGEAELNLSKVDEKIVSSATSVQTVDHEGKGLSVSYDVKESLEDCPGGSPFDGSNQHSADLGSFQAGGCASPEQKTDSPVLLFSREFTETEDVQTSQCQSMTSSEKPPLTDNQFLIGKGDCIKNIGAVDLFSFDAENNQAGKAEGCQNESVVVEEVRSAQLPGCAKGGSGQVILGNLGQMKADSQAVFETSKQDGQLPVDSGNIDSVSENDVRPTASLETLSMDVSKGVNIDDSHHELQTSGEREAATELAHHPECNAMAATISCSGFGEMRSVAISNSNYLCNEDPKKESSHVRSITEVSNASEVEARVADDSVQDSPSHNFAKSQQFVEKCNDKSSNRSSYAEATTSVHLDGPTVNLGWDNRTLKSSDTEVSMKNSEDQESPHDAELDKTSCGSPTIISSTEPSQLEKDDREEPRASELRHKFVEDNQPASEDVKRKDIVGDDSSFTFKVNALPESREPGKSWSLICDTEKCNAPIVVKESLPSGQGKGESMPSPKSPHQNARSTDVEPVHGTRKGASERKGRRGSGKGAARESAKKASQAKGTNQETSARKQDKGSNILFSAPSSSPIVQFGHMQSYGNMNRSKTKLTNAGVLPSLDFSVSSTLSKSTSPLSPGFGQPFTDLQQIQLRAQIFVYGSLIQGAAPDEACMVSAFGPSDVGRSSWEPIWRVAVERVQSQKSSSSGTETPLHSLSGVRASDSALKNSSHSSKGLAVSVNKVSSKDTPATIASPIIPLSSPLWCISTPLRDSLPSRVMHRGPVVDFQQLGTPLYQTSPIRSFIGHTSWPSQTCFSNPWLASAQTPVFSPTVHLQPVPMTETVKLTPAKDTSLPPTSAIKHVTSSSVVHTVSPSPVYGGVSSQYDPKATSSSDLHSGDPKPRKRKKGPATGPHHSSSVSGAQTVPVVIQTVGSFQTSAVGAPAAIAPAQVAVIGSPAADVLTVCSTDSPEFFFDSSRTGAWSEETLKYVAKAKTEAGEAVGHAAAAVTHSEVLWAELSKQKESSLTSEVEAKLVSAAAAIAAAASVAKAAAAAAKVACNAALQAKLLADEASFPNKLCSEVPSGNSLTGVHGIRNATPASVLKGDGESNQSTLVAAKVAAKRRVEAASKQAENLDTIVKAAELAAAAVSQAGKIVAMGEPLKLKDLIEAGPEGYWKIPQSPPEIAEKLRESDMEHSGAIGFEGAADVPGKAAGEYSAGREGLRKTSHAKIHRSGKLKDSAVGQLRLADGFTGDTESSPRRDGVKSPGVRFEPDLRQSTSNVQNELDGLAGTVPDDGIKEGSVVEVFKCGGDLKSAWYSANVLRLQDGKAYVSYYDLSSDGGSGNLCDWVSLESEGEKAPVIRIAHPSTSVLYHKTRKRRRATLGDYAWCVGDKVDVWIDDCWWEGVVTEKNEKDETTLKVHFPVQGESLNVRSWNLRTSRSWINGKWVDWSPLRAYNTLGQNDTPQEKRQKLGSPAIATKWTEKSSKDLDVAVAKPGGSKLLSLSMSERTFDIGKTIKEDKKYTARRPLRTGQQKEGSRVVFGVPKPTGKKRKFMEVSKHFPTNKDDKSTVTAYPVKPAKYLVPQGAGSRGWKIPSRNDSRDKRTIEARSIIPGTRKSQRTVPRRDNVGSTSGHDLDNGIARGTDVEDPLGGADLSEKGHQGQLDDAVEAPLSSLLPHSLSAVSKRTISSNRIPERLNRGNLAPLGAKLRKVEDDKVCTANSGKVDPEVNEPRRSNRRFQPTHRLLESLQSSTIIPKMPSVAHEKVLRNQNRSVLTRGK